MAATGTALSQPPVTMLNTLNATSAKYIAPILGDTVMKPSPAFWGLQRVAKHWAGGGQIVYSEITTEEMTGGSYWGDQLLNTTIVDSVQPANQEWRFYYQAIVIPLSDVILNGGLSNSLSLVKVKFQVASASLLQKLSRAMWGTAPQNTSTDIDSLVSWVQTTNNVIAGIDRSQTANAFWRRTPAWAMTGGINITDMTTAFWKVGRGFDIPDMILLFQDDYAKWEPQFTQNIRYTGNAQDLEALQVGFREHFKFKSCVVLNDPFINGTGTGFGVAGTGYIIHTKYIYPVFFKLQYFNIRPWMTPSQQFVMVSYIRLGWNVICVSPQRAGIQLTGL